MKKRLQKKIKSRLLKRFIELCDEYSLLSEEELCGWSPSNLAADSAKGELEKIYPKHKNRIRSCYINWGWKKKSDVIF